MLSLAPRLASAIQLQWSDGTTTRAFTEAVRCTLEVHADSAEQRLPREWRLLWVADTNTVITPIPLSTSLDCEADVAKVESLDAPANAADSAAHLLTAHFCSTGETAATLARYALDLAAGSSGKLKVVALDLDDSTRVIESNEVTFNGGAGGEFPFVILRTESSRNGLELTVTAMGSGLRAARSLSISAPDQRWRVGLSIVEQSDSTLAASASIAANVPVCVVEATAEDGAVSTATLSANSTYGSQAPLWYPSDMAETLGVSVTPPADWVPMQPMDFAFIHALSKYHLFYIRRRMVGDPDLTAKNLGHAWSTDLQTWHWSQLPRDTSVLDVSAGSWDNRHVWAPSIVVKDGVFHMFYTGVETAPGGKKHQRIGLATSTDLDSWSRPSGPILTAPDVPWALKNPVDFEGQQLRDPFVMPDPDRPGHWLMYFVAVDSTAAPAMAVGIAKSSGDFSQWVADRLPMGSTDSTHTNGAFRIQSPHAFSHEGRWWLGFTPASPHGNKDLLPYSPVTFQVSDSLGSPSDTVATHWTTPQDTLYYYNYPHPDPRLQYWHASEHLVVGEHEYLAAYDDSLMGIAIGEINWTGPRDFVVGSASASNVSVPIQPSLTAGAFELRITSAMPATSRVALRIDVASLAHVRLGIYDVTGRRVRSILDQVLLAGEREVTWDGEDVTGVRCASGIYFARLSYPGGRRIAKIVFLR